VVAVVVDQLLHTQQNQEVMVDLVVVVEMLLEMVELVILLL
jgi:hypothetical protein